MVENPPSFPQVGHGQYYLVVILENGLCGGSLASEEIVTLTQGSDADLSLGEIKNLWISRNYALQCSHNVDATGIALSWMGTRSRPTGGDACVRSTQSA